MTAALPARFRVGSRTSIGAEEAAFVESEREGAWCGLLGNPGCERAANG